MDMMLLGESMTLKPQAQYDGFWMPTAGNDGVGGFEVFSVDGTDLILGTTTKKSDEADPIPPNGTNGVYFLTTAVPGNYDFKIANAKDLIRYSIKNNSLTATINIHVQFAQPLWLPN